jgi:Xaa-Pro aminopeptidase
MQQVKERIEELRKLMREKGIQYYYITTADYHNSEYPGEYFKEREFMSGFTGSNGNLLVGLNSAGLWTDGRYFIQAEAELEGSGITLFRMAEEGVPTVTEYLKEELKQGQVLALDGRTVTAALGEQFEEILREKQGTVVYDVDLSDRVWKERPGRSHNPAFALDEAICGRTVAEKLRMVRDDMKEKQCSNLVLSKLDDIMWLFNIRGNDVECNPVALSYAVITENDSYLFLQPEAVTGELRQWLATQPVTLKNYDDVMGFLRERAWEGKVLLDKGNISYSIARLLREKEAKVVFGDNPTELLKAVKNEVELENIERVYLMDSLAVCRFMYWLKKNIGKIPMTELSAAQKMDDLRRELPGFMDLSFVTICGYGPNAAMMHYEATPEHYSELKPEGMLLVDSGGQYMGGTTDVTRTFALGKVTEEMKHHFTAVAMGMLRLLNAGFLEGCSGKNVDILAREPLWEMNIDYKCGTGHGIGYILNVHEGPQNVRWRFTKEQKDVPLKEGMILSNEPGVYIEGSHGIRTENIMVVKKGVKNGDGQFMHFDSLTWVPLDLELIDASYMERKDIQRLNDYHRQVYEKISPLMTEEEALWLKEATREIEVG